MRASISGNKPNSSTVSLGDVNITPAAYTAGSMKTATLVKTATSVNIPAGAYTVEIFNNSLDTNITVDGQPLFPQLKASYVYKINETTRKQDLLPAFVISNPSAQEIILRLEYPSDSAVNPLTI